MKKRRYWILEREDHSDTKTQRHRYIPFTLVDLVVPQHLGCVWMGYFDVPLVLRHSIEVRNEMMEMTKCIDMTEKIIKKVVINYVKMSYQIFPAQGKLYFSKALFDGAYEIWN